MKPIKLKKSNKLKGGLLHPRALTETEKLKTETQYLTSWGLYQSRDDIKEYVLQAKHNLETSELSKKRHAESIKKYDDILKFLRNIDMFKLQKIHRRDMRMHPIKNPLSKQVFFPNKWNLNLPQELDK